MSTHGRTRNLGRFRTSNAEADKLHRFWRSSAKNRLSVLVASVTQPFNVGTIVGSAVMHGADEMWLTGNSAPPTHPNSVKAALGAAGELPWRHVETVTEAAAQIRDAGYRLVALELTDDAVPFYEAPLAGDTCIAVGSEDHGCSPALLAEADSVTYIPQVGRVGSLNVSIAAGIALNEVRRREFSSLDGSQVE